MLKLLSILVLSLSLLSCGNKKPNKLPEGVVDKSEFPFPPNDEYELSLIHISEPTRPY